MTDNMKVLSDMAKRAEADPLAPLFGKVMAAQAADPNGFISLAVGAPDSNVLPLELTKKLINKVLDGMGPRALNYTRPQGLPPFCDAFVKRLEKQGVSYSPETQEILVTSGGMEAISMASEMLLNPGDVVLVESPGFPGAMSIFKLWGATIKHVDCDKDGMVPAALETAIKEHKPKLVLIMPDGQNPGGSTMPLERRQQVADILKAQNLSAIEDGAYSLLNYTDKVLPTLQSLAPDHVMHATSVSKILFPAARLGILLAPKQVVSTAASVKSAFNMQASGFMQAIAAEYLNPDNDYLDSYLPGLVKEYAKRRDAMVAALDKYFGNQPGYSWVAPQGGMFIWVEGPKTVDFTKFVDKAIASGVAYVPGNLFYDTPGQGTNAMRLNFASTPSDKIAEGVRRLAEVLKV